MGSRVTALCSQMKLKPSEPLGRLAALVNESRTNFDSASAIVEVFVSKESFPEGESRSEDKAVNWSVLFFSKHG